MAGLPFLDPDSVSRSGMDARFMGEALDLARAVAGRTWPNPPVGAVVVKDGRVVGRGAHQGPGTAHAEPRALDMAGELARGLVTEWYLNQNRGLERRENAQVSEQQ